MSTPTLPVDAEDVFAIIDVDSSVITDPDLTSFIRTADLIIIQLKANDLGGVLSAALVYEIECWLVAHFVSIKDPRTQSEGVKGMRVTWQGKTGMNLQSTFYGQTACTLDLTGYLVQLGKRSATFQVIQADLGPAPSTGA